MTIIYDFQYLFHQKRGHFLVKVFHLNQFVKEIPTFNQLLHYINIILRYIILINIYNAGVRQIFQYLHLRYYPGLNIHNRLILPHLFYRPNLARLLVFDLVDLCLPDSDPVLKFVNIPDVFLLVQDEGSFLCVPRNCGVQYSFFLLFVLFLFFFYLFSVYFFCALLSILDDSFLRFFYSFLLRIIAPHMNRSKIIYACCKLYFCNILPFLKIKNYFFDLNLKIKNI